MKKPIIGISGCIMLEEGGPFPGYELAYLNDGYVQSVLLGGGIPVILPVNEDPEVIEAQLCLVDGLIVSGGQDVDPVFYGEDPQWKLGGIYPKRDRFDEILIRKAMEKKIPLLGICRGMQLLNVIHGGSLYQDLSYYEKGYVKHVQDQFPESPTHFIEIKEGSWVSRSLGLEKRVNSYHHQGIKSVGDGLVATAVAKDGVIEAIEYEGDTFAVGIQWHPEMMSCDHRDMANLFKEFILGLGNR